MIRWIAAATCCLIACMPVAAQSADAKSPEIKAADIDAAVMRYGLGQFWGGVVVGKGGKIIFAKGYGVADENLTPIGPDTLFDIGSISKQFTAAAILRLEMDGKLAIDDPVAKFFPELGGEADARAKAITLRHLLTHTSGMTDQSAIQRLDFTDRDEAVKKAFAAPPLGEVGQRFDYCNAGYVVLAAVIERASGRAFEDFMREEVFKRAGLTSTGFLDGIGLNPAKQTLRVIPARGGGRERRAPLFTSPVGEPWAWGLKGAGGVLTTMEDIVRWDAALRTDSVLNNSARYKLSQTEQGGYALGRFVEPTVSQGVKMHHGGATRGFHAHVSRFLKEDVVVAVFTNETSDADAIERLVVGSVLPDEIESVELELNLSGMTMNRWKVAEAENGLVCKWVADGDRFRLDATLEETPVARVWFNRKAAMNIASQAAEIARDEGRERSDGAVVIGTLPYQIDASGSIHLKSGLSCRIMPEYVGVDPQTGQRSVDKRMTFIVDDAGRGFWPLILKLNQSAAARFAFELEGVRAFISP